MKRKPETTAWLKTWKIEIEFSNNLYNFYLLLYDVIQIMLVKYVKLNIWLFTKKYESGGVSFWTRILGERNFYNEPTFSRYSTTL